ncbi:MAG: hypothetical protein GY925_12945 [Actinomycetia bacterium]|nr:hypothetical protein [Actinomycetes bacterium]
MARRNRTQTYLDRLVEELGEAAAQLDGIVEESTIKHFNWNDPSSSVVSSASCKGPGLRQLLGTTLCGGGGSVR